MPNLFDVSYIIIIIIIFIISALLFLPFIFVICFELAELPDTIISENLEGKTKSKKYRKSYCISVNNNINYNIKYKFPDLSLKTYLKETKKYRNIFGVFCYPIYFKEEKPKSNLNKKSFAKEIEIEKIIFNF